MENKVLKEYIAWRKAYNKAHQHMPVPKYQEGDVVTFSLGKEATEGMILIVDRYGTIEQNKEASYDIYRFENNTLYKHIVQSLVTSFIRHGDVQEIDRNAEIHLRNKSQNEETYD